MANDIQEGMIVVCDIPNCDQAWPEERRKRLGYVLGVRQVGEEMVADVATLQSGGAFKAVIYDLQGVGPLSFPMAEWAQRQLAAMAQIWKRDLNTLELRLDLIKALVKLHGV